MVRTPKGSQGSLGRRVLEPHGVLRSPPLTAAGPWPWDGDMVSGVSGWTGTSRWAGSSCPRPATEARTVILSVYCHASLGVTSPPWGSSSPPAGQMGSQQCLQAGSCGHVLCLQMGEDEGARKVSVLGSLWVRWHTPPKGGWGHWIFHRPPRGSRPGDPSVASCQGL